MTENKISDWQSAEMLVSLWRQGEEKIVFTNGCFDLLHIGHVDYLEKAAGLGHRLVVGLNTDASVRQLKGPQRPLNPQLARARVLAALECVDAVILFDEPTPQALIEALRPDILVKGDDYAVENIAGADFVINHGGSVQTLPLVQGFSTSELIRKIRETP